MEVERSELDGTRSSINADTETFNQSWGLDALGNWVSFNEDSDGDGTDETSESRTHNAANEVTGITGGASSTPNHDAVGNMTSVSQPGETTVYTAVYDAWNRLVELQDSATSDTLYTYGYDLLGRRVTESTYVSGVLDETRDFYHSVGDQVVEERVTPASTGTERLDRQYVWDAAGYIDSLVLQDQDTTGDGVLDTRHYALTDETGTETGTVSGTIY